MLSIVGNMKGYEDWFYSNYIQIFGDNHQGGLNFFEHDFTRIKQPLLSTHSVCMDGFVKSEYDFIEFVCHSLDLGYYIYTYVDEMYIPGKLAHKMKQPFPHDILLFGYDSDLKQFESVGFSGDFQYKKAKVSFENLNDAFTHTKITASYLNNIHLLQPNADAEYPF